MSSRHSNKEVGTFARRPFFSWFKFTVGASGAVGTVTQGGGLSFLSVVRTSIGLYTVTFNPPNPLAQNGLINVTPRFHRSSGTGPSILCDYKAGTFAVSGTGVATFQFNTSGNTAAGDTTQVLADPTSGGEIQCQVVESRDPTAFS